MKLSWFGRLALALFASLALGLGMSACGGGTIGYLWVLGQQYNEIASFKVDDYTGNLTQTPHQPFPSGGSNPVTILVKIGGRYVYVLNQGSGDTPTSNSADAGISAFSVGGDGSLTLLQTYSSIQGFTPVWMQFDSANNYLYVLSKYSPSGDGNGAITLFSVDPTTGRLFGPIQNTQSTPPGSTPQLYWEVGKDPIMMKTTGGSAGGGGCLFTVNSADNSITPYSESPAGQLITVTTGNIATNAASISSINGNSSYIILTDNTNNVIFPYTVAGACALSSFSGGAVPNQGGTTNPVNSLVSTSNKYVYVLNYSTTSTQPNSVASSISGFLIQNGQLEPLTGSPYSVGSGPVCMVEDPTNKYMYISDHLSGQVTGKFYNDTSGALSQLSRGSDFAATGLSTCMAISGAVD